MRPSPIEWMRFKDRKDNRVPKGSQGYEVIEVLPEARGAKGTKESKEIRATKGQLVSPVKRGLKVRPDLGASRVFLALRGYPAFLVPLPNWVHP